ncbi:MAG: hypothetical protein IE909_02920 [Campylobacterales bacterium]|nr:hypothetical protein [Campylobacterales bacterium]
MLKSLLLTLFIMLLQGCATSKVVYDSPLKINTKNVQEYHNEECVWLLGPFPTTSPLSIQDAIEKSIKKANQMGLYGNTMTNVTVQEGGFNAILFSQLCLYIDGNIEYDPSKL